MKELKEKLKEEALEVLNHRADRLNRKKRLLGKWLRWHKVRRELRKFKRMKDALSR